MISEPTFRFASAKTANQLVAGVPAAARLARAYQGDRPGAMLRIAIGDGEREQCPLKQYTKAEIVRLAPTLAIRIVEAEPQQAISAEAALRDMPNPVAPPAARERTYNATSHPDWDLREAERRIIKATGKPQDGIVSRYCNRPLSRSLSKQLLRISWIRPGHATAVTAATALAMLTCLTVVTTPAGLAVGAVLFQLASVFDGMDGEIARATHRSSKTGASLDSLIDAFTNCAFLAGAGWSFAMQRDDAAAFQSLAAACTQVVGLSLLGQSAWKRERMIHFENTKAVLKASSSKVARMLKSVASRDFYCFIFMLAGLGGVLAPVMTVFLAASTIWLLVVAWTKASQMID